MLLNCDKTKYMVFTNKLKVITSDPILSLSGTCIEQVASYKYLGIWLDEDLSFKTHITNLSKKTTPSYEDVGVTCSRPKHNNLIIEEYTS